MVKSKKLIACCILLGICISLMLENYSQASAEEKTEEITIVSKGEILEVDFASMFHYAFYNNITGEGYIRWDGWSNITEETELSGNLYIPYINDSVYTSMKLPSEVSTIMSYRVNPSLGKYQPQGYINAVGMGAIYPVTGSELPNEFDVCIGKFETFVLKDKPNAEWEILDRHEPLDSKIYFRIAKLPWKLGKSWRVPEEKIEYHEDYVKFNLKKEDLDNQVLHFYGIKQPCISEDTIGIVVIFEVWSNTANIEGKLSCAIGADQRNASGDVSQAFSGRNYMVLNVPRLIIGHNMPDIVYEECVDKGKNPEKCLELFLQD